MRMQEDDKEIIKLLILDLLTSFEEKNIEGIMKHYSAESSVYLIGTGEIELVDTFEQISKMWEDSFSVDRILIENVQILNLQIDQNIAWCAFIGDLTIQDQGIHFHNVTRITVVLEKQRDYWLIRQWHASFPQIGDEEGGGWPTVQGIENKIINLINEFDLNPNIKDRDKRIALKKYLIKAKDIASSMSLS